MPKRHTAKGHETMALPDDAIAMLKADHRKVLKKLFDDIGPRYKERPGGYTRIIKRHERRLGDAGKTAFIELLKEGETKPTRAKARTSERAAGLKGQILLLIIPPPVCFA